MKTILLLAVALVVAPLPAAAASLAGKSDALSLQALHNFARCVVQFTPAGPKRLLSMDFRAPAYNTAMAELMRGHARCTTPGSELRANRLLVAGSLAEALLSLELSRPIGPALAYDEARPPIVARGPSEAMALCIVRRVPDAVARLLASEPASEAEIGTQSPIAAESPGCLAKGRSLKLNPPGLRALVALAAYRVAVGNGAVRGVPAG